MLNKKFIDYHILTWDIIFTLQHFSPKIQLPFPEKKKYVSEKKLQKKYEYL